LAVGTVFVLSAKSKYNDSLANCATNDPNRCTAQGVTQRDDARSAGTIATIGFGVGAAGLAAAVILWVTAPSSRASSPTAGSIQVSPTLGGAVVQGAF
jgi:hypothetical protein